jgi:hypothetical protein
MEPSLLPPGIFIYMVFRGGNTGSERQINPSWECADRGQGNW